MLKYSSEKYAYIQYFACTYNKSQIVRLFIHIFICVVLGIFYDILNNKTESENLFPLHTQKKNSIKKYTYNTHFL